MTTTKSAAVEAMALGVELPTFAESDCAVGNGTQTDLQQLIYECEPAGARDLGWRASLLRVLQEARRDALTALCALHPGIQAVIEGSDGWQDISTAPKDGHEILLAFGFGFESAAPPLVAAWSKADDFWVLVGAEVEVLTTPTHWRPLPPPPAEEKPA